MRRALASSLAFFLAFPLSLAAQVVEVRLPASGAPAPIPVLSPLAAAPSLSGTLAAAALLAPAAPLLPAAPVPSALAPVPARPAATIALARFAADPAAVRAFLASHPDGGSVNPDRFQELVERVFLSVPRRKGSTSLAALRSLAEEKGDEGERALVRVLADLPRLTAEGMIRSSLSAPSPKKLDTLQKGWPKDKKGRPIADAVVIGAGPAGLSAALHAAHAGLKTVVFEAGYAAQSFSDAGMKSVYRMRTPTTRNSLLQAPFSPPELVAELGMAGRLADYRAAGQAADDALYARTGLPPIGGARAGLESADPGIASARNELLQHFSEVAAEIGRRGGILAELSPVASVTKDADGLYTITANGRVQRARKLILAQGQVGTSVEHVRVPKDLVAALGDAGLSSLLLRDHRDLARESKTIDGWLRTLSAGRRPSRRLVLNDALLGSAEMERGFRLLPRGTRAMIVGSGESAVKAAVAVLRLNPGVSVDLFVKERLEPAQLQLPAAHAAPEAIARALTDPDEAARTIAEWEAFGTPVTPATLADLEALKAAGRLRVIALGKKCIAAACDAAEPDPAHTVELSVDERGVLRVYASDPAVIAQLRKDGIGSREAGTGRWLIGEIDGPLISSTGYDRTSLRRDPLTSGLSASGLLRAHGGRSKATINEFAMSRSNPLVSAADPDLYFVGPQNVAMSADSAIPGAVARAAAVVADIKASLSSRPGRASWRARLRRGLSAFFGR